MSEPKPLQGKSERDQPDCSKVRELIPAYSIGTTDPDETAFVQANLIHCPDAVADLAAFSGLSEALHYAVPKTQAPAHLLKRILAKAGAPERKTRKRPAPRWWQVAAAIVIVLLIASNLYALLRLNAQERLLAEYAAAANAHYSALAMFGWGTTQRVTLPAMRQYNGLWPSAEVVSHPKSDVAVLYIHDFPPLPPEKVYQVWLTRGMYRISGGLFRVDEAGATTFVIEAPEPLGAYDSVGITPEPVGGSAGPTAPPVVRGSLQAERS